MSFGILRRRRVWLAAIAVAATAFVTVLVGASWYYAGEVQSGAFELDRGETEYPLVVAAIADGNVTLEAASDPDELDQPGLLGLESNDGYGRVGPILSQTRNSVTRAYEPISEELAVGDRVRYDRSAFPVDPEQGLGLVYSEVQIAGPLGDMPAWHIPGDGDTWLIAVHGRTATRSESLRFIAATRDWRLPTLAISYRNDLEAPDDPSGEYKFGITEWADLDAAVKYATQAGATRLILVGLSMGGGIVAHYMDKAEDTDMVVGLVLDAPMTNLTSALNLAAKQRGVPQPIPFFAAWVSALRFGVDWGELDTRDILIDTSVPVLLFHGTGDATIPVGQSRDFAREAGARVTYVEVPDAAHVGSWNVDPAAYEAALDGWLPLVLPE